MNDGSCQCILKDMTIFGSSLMNLCLSLPPPPPPPQTDVNKDGVISLSEFMAYTAKDEKFDENEEWKPVVDDPNEVPSPPPPVVFPRGSLYVLFSRN